MDTNKYVKRVLVTEEQIKARCEELGKQIDKDYAGKTPILLSLLRGSVPFCSELAKHISIEIEFDYMRASSYHGGTVSCGNVAVSVMPQSQLTGRHILIVEDIIDTGTTLDTVVKILQEQNPASIEIVTLLDKPDRRLVEIKPKYVAFTIPNEFVFGFGLDVAELYRQLPYVAVFNTDYLDEVTKKNK